MVRERLPLAALLFALVAGMAGAAEDTEFYRSSGPLSDDAFYRALACGGAEGAQCARRIIKWAPHERQGLAVSLAGIGAHVPEAVASALGASIDRAIAEINAAGAGIRLVRDDRPGNRAAIAIFGVDAGVGEVMRTVDSRIMRGSVIQVGHVHVIYRHNEIRQAHIGISRDIPLGQMDSVVLEELVQALGLLTDILNPYYKRRSIFAEDCNCTRRLRGQDAIALRLHYPPEGETGTLARR